MHKAIKILFLAANPADTTRLRLDKESREIKDALQKTEFRDHFEFEQEWAVSVNDLQALLLHHKPDIVHFSGHGSDEGDIILEAANYGDAHLRDEERKIGRGGTHKPGHVSPRALSKVFELLKDNIRCVVLNACYSEEQANAIANHVDVVIGMSSAIGDSSAIVFAKEFYQALGYGQDIANAFNLACNGIDLNNLDEQDKPKIKALRTNPASTYLVKEARAAIDKRLLRKTIVEHFSLEEVSELCADIQNSLTASGIKDVQVSLDYVGGNSLPAKVLNLIEYLDRRVYLSYLVSAVRQVRPGII